MLTLHEKTRELLVNRPITLTYDQIEKDTGIPRRWLKEIVLNDGINPGVNTVQKLYEYLSGRTLTI